MAKRCCKQCGRDTNSTYCSTCSPYYHGKTGHEQKIRKSDQIETHEDMLIREEEDNIYNGPVKIDPYNGATSRDDI